MSLAQWTSFVGPPVTTLLIIFGIVVVRGTKITEFRQKWIDEQRVDIALMLAHSGRVAQGLSTKPEEDLLLFDLAANRLKLRENPRRPEWTEAISVIDVIRSKLVVTPGQTLTAIDITSEQASLIDQARSRLKLEWRRVRAGELGYKLLIGLAAILALASLLPLIGAILFQLAGIDIGVTPRSLLEQQVAGPAKPNGYDTADRSLAGK